MQRAILRLCLPGKPLRPQRKRRDDRRICRMSGMRHLHDCLRVWFRKMEISQKRIRCPVSVWMMETKSTFDNTVALIRSQRDANSLPQAPDLYQGLQGNSSTTQILIKPNPVFWDDSFPYEVLYPPGEGGLVFLLPGTSSVRAIADPLKSHPQQSPRSNGSMRPERIN